MNSKLGYLIYLAILAQGFINLFIIHGLEFNYSKIKISYYIIQLLKFALFFIETEQTSYNYVLTIITGLWWVLGFLVRFFYIIKLFSDIISPILQVVRSFIDLLANYSSVIY